MRFPSNNQRIFQTITKSKTHQIFQSKSLIPYAQITPYSSMATTRHIPNSAHIISMLHNSKLHQSISIAKIAHSFILRTGFSFHLHISNNLLHCYSFCGSITYAINLFEGMLHRDAISWNTMISGFIRLGKFVDGFSCFVEMVRVGIFPTQSTFASVTVACAEMGSIKSFEQVHCFSLKHGFSSDCCVGNSLLKGYSKIGRLESFSKVSDEMCGLDAISVEILLRGYAQHGLLGNAFDLLRYCNINGIRLSSFSVSSLISLCSRLCCIDMGLQVHGYSVKAGLDTDVSVNNALISMYSRDYRLEDAENLFDWIGIRRRDTVTWNSLMGGFAYNGEGDAGLGLVPRMLSSGVEMTESTFLNFLSCCSSVTSNKNAKQAHALILKLRDCFNQETDNIVLTMYFRSKSLNDAVALFNAMKVEDIVSVNLMMGLYRNYGMYEDSIQIFFQARGQGTVVDEVSVSAAICCCSKLNFLELGQQIHGLVLRTGFGMDSYVTNAVLELYSGIGRVDDMERVFSYYCNKNDIFSWNMMLMGYSHHGLLDKSIAAWKEMEKWGLEVNEFSFSALLDTCSCVNDIAAGEQIHACTLKKGLAFDTALMNSLLTMYSSFGMMEKSHSVFEEISSPDSISWNAMVSGYSQNGYAEESIKFYTTMNMYRVEINHMTFASICMSCGMLSELKLGFQLHAQVIKRAFESVLPVLNSLITMYSKCGKISPSSKIFDATDCKDVITWNSMITALSRHGLGREAIHLFDRMKSSGVQPNNVTLIAVLSACSHAGLELEAFNQFKSMYENYGITPSEEHYSCIVDILCRAGKLEEAKDLIEGMHFVPSSMVWKTLLSGCRVNGNLELGKLAATRIMEMDPCDSSAYVLLSGLYASLGNGDHKAEVRRVMEDRGVKKEVGCSWILN